MKSRAEVESAIAVLSAYQARLRETSGATSLALSTALAVLREDLAEATPEREGAVDERRKQVTILFAALDGVAMALLAAPDGERRRLVKRLWQRLDDTVTFHGGVVDKHMGDVVMGVFGVPVARENDPEQAIRCALAIEAAARDFLDEFDPDGLQALERPSPVRIGVNTGQVVLGRVGTDEAQTVIGDPVNVASRLKEAAEGGVIISHETYRLVEHLVRAEPLGLFPVKGRQTPVSVYRVNGLRPRTAYSSGRGVRGVSVPMVGRAAELERLQTALRETVSGGRGRLLTVMGEAGVGKSRLVAEFLHWTDHFPVRTAVLQGHTEQRNQPVPYGLMRDVLVNHLGISDSEPPAAVEQKLIAGLATALSPGRHREQPIQALRERARALGSLVGLDLPARDLGGDPDAASARERGSIYLIDYFGALSARNPALLLVCEDIHWADDESLDLLERLGRLAGTAPLLVVCLARPLLLERRPEWPGARAGSSEGIETEPFVMLDQLAETESRELVGHILRKLDDTPPELVELIVKSSGGNPYFIEELIKVLIEDGLIATGDTRWELRPEQWQQAQSRLRVPATLTGVLQARLDRLPELERATLQKASIFGEEFWDSAVQQMNGESRQPFAPAQVQDALAGLEARDLVHRIPSAFEGTLAFRFKHAVLRNVTYDSVLLRDRPGFHLSAARWLEEQSGDRVGEYAAPVGEHLERAGRWVEAATTYQAAALRAEEMANLPGAISFYRRAIGLLGERPQTVERRLWLLERLGRVLQQQGRLVEAAAAYEAMRAAAELDGSLQPQSRAEAALATLAGLWRRPEELLLRAAAAGQLAWLTGAQPEFIRATRLQAEGALMEGRLDDALLLAGEAMRLAEAAAAEREYFAAMYCQGDAQARAGRVDEALATADQLARAGREAGEAGRRVESATALRLAGRLCSRPGSLDRAAALLSEARSSSTADREAGAEALADWGHVCLAGEQWPAAEAAFAEAAAHAESIGAMLLRWRCDLGLAQALLGAGRAGVAATRLRVALRQMEAGEGVGRWPAVGTFRAWLARGLLALGQPEAAQAEAEAALALALETGAPLSRAAAWTALAEVLAARAGSDGPAVIGGESLEPDLCLRRALEAVEEVQDGPEKAVSTAAALRAWAGWSSSRGDGRRAEELQAAATALAADWAVA
jgi:class 3 adenylate cyclase